MNKGIIGAFILILVLLYIFVFAGPKAYDPNTVKYVDTSGMMSHYFRSIDTTNHWIPKGTTFPDSVQFFKSTGRINQRIKIWSDTLAASSASGMSVDISSASFTSILSVSAVAEQNTATATSVANVGIKSYSTTAVVLNMTTGNGSLINVLGNNVLLGPSTAFATTSGLRIHVTVMGF